MKTTTRKLPEDGPDAEFVAAVEAEVRGFKRQFLNWLALHVEPPDQAPAMLAFLETTLDWCVDTLGEKEGLQFVESVYRRVAGKRKTTTLQ